MLRQLSLVYVTHARVLSDQAGRVEQNETKARLRPGLTRSARLQSGSQLTIGGSRFHAVNIVPANWPLHLMRSRMGSKRLALLPVVAAEDGCAARSTRHDCHLYSIESERLTLSAQAQS